jgi:hypothetical protein
MGGSLHGASHFNSYVNPNVWSDTQSLNLIQIKKQEKKQTIRFFCALGRISNWPPDCPYIMAKAACWFNVFE